MLVLESQKFDLNALFSFDSLKLILIKLAKSQKALEDEIKTLQKNIYQNDKININIKNDEPKKYINKHQTKFINIWFISHNLLI